MDEPKTLLPAKVPSILPSITTGELLEVLVRNIIVFLLIKKKESEDTSPFLVLQEASHHKTVPAQTDSQLHFINKRKFAEDFPATKTTVSGL